jgi:hypothetical protein
MTDTHLYESDTLLVPLADVQHVERHSGPGSFGLVVVMKSTRWDFTQSNWENNVWVDDEEAERFLAALRNYVQWIRINSLKP